MSSVMVAHTRQGRNELCGCGSGQKFKKWCGAAGSVPCVPVVSLAGTTHSARVGVSLLNAVGLPELVAQTPDEHVALAASLAQDPERLSVLRKGLRQRMAASPLTNAAAFTRKLEAAFRQMWTRWCAQHTDDDADKTTTVGQGPGTVIEELDIRGGLLRVSSI
jgi:Glycosyl transferase family 41